MVVVAHPDDEVLGCGGAIASHRRNGDRVTILIMADGVTSRAYNPQEKISRVQELARHDKAILSRRKEALKAGASLGVAAKDIIFMNLADQRLDSYPFLDVVKHVEMVKQKVKPSLVYTHFWNDFNKDHQLVCQAVLTAFRPAWGKKNTAVFHMEIPESTCLSVPCRGADFIPDHFVDIAKSLPAKLKALKVYESEARKSPHPRSVEFIETLASQRGQQSGLKLAEAFVNINMRTC
ncbi:MAG: PIG-L family deacetylase [Candidatus Omnitrophica bacterium]|nr:PIG-L family deacetylase [Candidatus Omnitrophota bacterium]